MLLGITLSGISQNYITGVYHWSGFENSVRLNLLTDYLFVYDNFSRSSNNKYFGKWKQNGDTLILFTNGTIKNMALDSTIKDTSFFIVHKNLFLEEINKYNLPNNKLYKQIEYYPSGKIRLEIKNYNHLYFDGIQTIYTEDGKIEEIIEYKKGKKNGEYFKYNKQGILVARGRYKKGIKKGLWLYYDDFGFPI